ncbi:ROK family protein [Lusitaniella coriacea]|uniref:ROK family protein n=1 Tax=Lusitaniella coriacea TaxID=1983105 RepID=UPI003CF933B8
MTDKTLRTLAVDIGGSGVKVMVLDEKGNPLTERDRVKTPKPPKPEPILDAIASLASKQTFDRVSVGFPGVVKEGVTYTAVNLDPDWHEFDLATALSQRLEKPVRAVNDADMQGLGAVSSQGVEAVITLGTGFGFGLFLRGQLVPNVEMGHHRFRKGETYEEQLGRAALDKIGKKRWNNRLKRAIASLEHLLNYDTLYIGGGETKHIDFELPANVKIVPNVSGLLGGIALWKD